LVTVPEKKNIYIYTVMVNFVPTMGQMT